MGLACNNGPGGRGRDESKSTNQPAAQKDNQVVEFMAQGLQRNAAEINAILTAAGIDPGQLSLSGKELVLTAANLEKLILDCPEGARSTSLQDVPWLPWTSQRSRFGDYEYVTVRTEHGSPDCGERFAKHIPLEGRHSKGETGPEMVEMITHLPQVGRRVDWSLVKILITQDATGPIATIGTHKPNPGSLTDTLVGKVNGLQDKALKDFIIAGWAGEAVESLENRFETLKADNQRLRETVRAAASAPSREPTPLQKIIRAVTDFLS